jgi:hypothetical protein
LVKFVIGVFSHWNILPHLLSARESPLMIEAGDKQRRG